MFHPTIPVSVGGGGGGGGVAAAAADLACLVVDGDDNASYSYCSSRW